MNTTLEQYKKITQDNTKKVTLPNGIIFTIKKLNSRELMDAGELFLTGYSSILTGATEKAINKKPLTPEETISLMKQAESFMIKAVIDPPLSLKEEDGKLCLKNIDDVNFNFLSNEITSYSFGKGETLKIPSSKENNVSDIGSTS
jgi:hypothetical protein